MLINWYFWFGATALNKIVSANLLFRCIKFLNFLFLPRAKYVISIDSGSEDGSFLLSTYDHICHDVIEKVWPKPYLFDTIETM